MIEYSVIIPHKNIPKLLQRCLDSIPQRDDLEVIVIDDNSDPDIVDFEHFPGLDRKDTTVIFDKSGKGAGRARNIGLEHAKGRWLLFADADDYFNYCIRDILDEYMMDESDIIFFSASSVDCETYNNVDRADYVNNFIAIFYKNQEEGEKLLRYIHGAPWSKLMKRRLAEINKVKFQESSINNDVRFCSRIGYYAKQVKVDKRALYCLTQRQNSIQSGLRSEEKILESAVIMAELYIFLFKHNIKFSSEFSWWSRIYINRLADAIEYGNEYLYARSLDMVTNLGIPRKETEKLVNIELQNRKKNRREDWLSKLRDRVAFRTRIRRCFNC